ncbi:hypothetical protein GGD81_000715 [Rhodobium orientis]|uniref:PAS domain-containing protein n=1 Tax=Rhodobium orientis TaxID=34017 RepID=A0A327JYI5_9HYPH|nr:PAS domain-containing protein [Rhodobium orientis]MBB4301698.1 hypothetical protein [Rhodobium orientis]MBK5952392.1 hypothetical protein [Rhodobium orientis]RAI28148.1 hypothetical protein CH339_07310 [Rhodobium orientis]
MKLAATRRLYDYWSRLRGDQPAPERRDIEPSDIREILGDTFILEAAGSQTYPFRLAGTRMCAAFCRELKEREFLRLWQGRDREAVATMLAAVTEDAAAAVFGFKGHTETGKSLNFELLLLPLRFGEMTGTYSRVLGTCTPVEQPYWLGIQPIMTQEIVSVRLIWPDEKPYFLRAADAIDDNDIVINPAVRGMLGRFGHLTLYQGGRQ